MHQQQLQDAVSEATRHNSMAKWSELETTLQESERNAAALQEELSEVQHGVQELEHRRAADREAMLWQSGLDRYRAVEEERRKWEEGESRWYAKLTSAEEESSPWRAVVIVVDTQQGWGHQVCCDQGRYRLLIALGTKVSHSPVTQPI